MTEPRLLFVIPVLALLGGCAVPVAASLDERDANLVADVLARAGLDTEKQPDPEAEGRYRVMVPRDEAPQAVATLHAHDLPPRHAPGVVDSLGKGALVPSQLAEHAQYVAGLSGDLERTIASIDGVLGARVHLSVPAKTPFSDAPADKPTASLLIKHRGATPPINEADVRRLVAGSVANLQAENVSVIMVGRPAGGDLPSPNLAHVGPIGMTKSGAIWIRVALGVLSTTVLALIGMVVYQRFKLSKLSETMQQQEGRA